jgi:hypothetical protein
MKSKLFFVWLLLASLAAAQVDLSKPVPVIRLPDGRVHKNVTFLKFGPAIVTIRSHLGTSVIRYEFLPDDVRSAAEQQRPGGPKWFPGDTSGNTEVIEGQVFLQTQGASSYKFGNTEVYAFDLALLTHLDNTGGKRVRLPLPIHRTTTDADGKFTLKVPVDRPYFIFCQASRFIAAGDLSETVSYEWRVPMSAVRQGKLLQLSSEHRFPVSRVEIEERP